MRDGTTDLESRRARRRRHHRRDSDRGAALVEFAFVALPLFILIFGVIEFGWAFYQLNEVRHGSREGLRLVAVDADPTPAYTGADMDNQGKRIAQATCERMSRSDGITISIAMIDLNGDGKFQIGDDASVTVTKPLEQLTNLFSPILNSVVLDENITTRLEQDSGPTVNGTVWTCK